MAPLDHPTNGRKNNFKKFSHVSKSDFVVLFSEFEITQNPAQVTLKNCVCG